ncbi:hypothetical protein DES53_10737 [Roseimicrobium gellanilyticum]|uniref:Uncharacterized protein n=1 Tax=Roseimicrobium gellanilyticum TaxID=748857 RepID=A0A366HFC5_9BACT|nr:hypothetical protein [Roseimicrobium gellanilyticum]RBP41208.1 hypothetical protein DES53_10737 [Roseimicrobium gellanilyticum]
MKCELTYPEKKDDWRPFRVVVHDCALGHLMTDAQQALRVYEFMCIARPGDVCKYLWVELLDVPADARYRAEEARKKVTHPPEKLWPENFVPLVEFDTYFNWLGDDTHSEDACWLGHREGWAFRKAIRGWFDKVVEIQRLLRASKDILIRFELALMNAKAHPYDVDPEPPFWRTRPDYQSRAVPQRPSAYYEKLRELLRRPDLESLTMTGRVDYQAFRLICATQRERAETSGKHPYQVFPIGMTIMYEEWDRGWGTHIIEYSEGVAYGDMWILHDDDDGGHMKWLVETRHDFHRWFFFHQGAVEIQGYRMTQGDGWALLEDETTEREYRIRGKAWLEASFRRWRENETKRREQEGE